MFQQEILRSCCTSRTFAICAQFLEKLCQIFLKSCGKTCKTTIGEALSCLKPIYDTRLQQVVIVFFLFILLLFPLPPVLFFNYDLVLNYGTPFVFIETFKGRTIFQ